MNTIWSEHVQGVKTLFQSRSLRFAERFAERYKKFLKFEDKSKLLEVGCGPGALAGALHRWYPNAQIAAIDRDSNFIEFAKKHVDGVQFFEGDATALPFADGTFDATISYTVSEHIEPSKFFGEQLRVLRKGGVCTVLSNVKTIENRAACLADGEYERAFWERAAEFDDTIEKYAVGKYRMDISELPAAMEMFGFKDVVTDYTAIGLTPDDGGTAPAEARAIIDEWRRTALDGLEGVRRSMPERFTAGEFERMRRIITEKYDGRIALLESGRRQWDSGVCLTMMIRAVKR